jgi:hypothetical protein
MGVDFDGMIAGFCPARLMAKLRKCHQCESRQFPDVQRRTGYGRLRHSFVHRRKGDALYHPNQSIFSVA